MKRLLMILFPILPFLISAQNYVRVAHGNTVYLVNITGADSVALPSYNKTGYKLWGILDTVTINALATKQVAGTYATGTGSATGTNTGDNANNTQYSGLAASKENTITPGTTAQYWRGDKTFQTLDKAAAGLSNVDNTSNATERSASAVLTSKTLGMFNYAADAGASDSYVITLSPAPASYTTGMQIIFKANTVNTGAASINVNSLGVKTIVKRVSTALANGDIPALQFCLLIYDGTNFVLLNPVVN